jgi:hypothetical protein
MMRIERWGWVVGYEGLYQVSDKGRVLRFPQRDADGRLIQKEKLLRGSPRDKGGRLCVALRKDGVVRTEYIDRIVLAAWVGPIAEGQAVLHGGAGIADNYVENLSYGSRTCKRRKRKKGVCIIRSDDTIFISIAQAAECSGIDESGIRRACKSEAGRAGKWGWERIE